MRELSGTWNRLRPQGAFVKHLFLTLAAAACLMAADATGRWTGTMTTNSAADGPSERPAYLVLKQAGTELTGTAGPSSDHQMAIQNGKAVDGALTFEVPAGDGVMKFKLKQTGDEIQGDITRERDGQSDSAKLAVKREK
jgi:hypothetical protein